MNDFNNTKDKAPHFLRGSHVYIQQKLFNINKYTINRLPICIFLENSLCPSTVPSKQVEGALWWPLVKASTQMQSPQSGHMRW